MPKTGAMNYGVETDTIGPRGALRHRFVRSGAPLTTGQAHRALVDDAAFRTFLTERIAAAPFEALFWETPPATVATLDHAFEYVLTDSSALARTSADPAPFSAQFPDSAVVARFASLGGDARLIAPAPLGQPAAYAHLARFLREGPAEQIDALWRAVGDEMQAAVGATPRWLSTSGLGVAWLHMRIDTRPKYYVHAPYRTPA